MAVSLLGKGTQRYLKFSSMCPLLVHLEGKKCKILWDSVSVQKSLHVDVFDLLFEWNSLKDDSSDAFWLSWGWGILRFCWFCFKFFAWGFVLSLKLCVFAFLLFFPDRFPSELCFSAPLLLNKNCYLSKQNKRKQEKTHSPKGRANPQTKSQSFVPLLVFLKILKTISLPFNIRLYSILHLLSSLLPEPFSPLATLPKPFLYDSNNPTFPYDSNKPHLSPSPSQYHSSIIILLNLHLWWGSEQV